MNGKRIVLGISGGIAAYKTPLLVRQLIKAGAELQVVVTPSAKDFVTPLTLSTLSKRPVLCESHNTTSGEWVNHVELGLWTDLLIVAPATANTLAKMASGLCDNLLLSVYLSARSKVLVAPAMDLDMWKHPSTQRNISVLKNDGVHLVGPATGELASGLSGEGRMAGPDEIFSAALQLMAHA